MHRRFRPAFLLLAVALCAVSTSVLSAEEPAPAPTTAATPAAPALPTPATNEKPAPDATKPAVPAPATPPAISVTPGAPAAEQGKKADQAPPQIQLVPQALRVGVVDIGKIERESKQGKSAQAKVKAKREKLQSQIVAKQKQLEKQKADIEAKLPTMSPEERAAKAKEFEKKVEDYRKLVQKADTELKPLVEEVTRNLSKSLQEAAATYGKSSGLALIVTLKDIVYLGAGTNPEDVTDAVLKLMNEKQKPR